MTTKHTPGKLCVIGGALETEDGLTRIALMDRNEERTRPTERDANAARLALCWNMHDQLDGFVQDGALQFGQLSGPALEIYARTWATLARAVLAKLESTTTPTI